jgi:uncharacterized protein YndB with AHSA1/START domain
MTNEADQTALFTVPPVRKARQVAWPPGEAFDRFCEVGSWWPLTTHSLGGAEATAVAFELLEVGGRLVERWRSGEAHVWGTIVAFDRPARLSFTWHVGRGEDLAQLIELTFKVSGAGTLVELTHSGWERLGERAAELRENYDNGWEPVMDRYAAVAT